MDNSDEDHCGGSGFGMDFSVLFSRPFLGVKVAGYVVDKTHGNLKIVI